jgi:hypothetical protein
MGWQGSSRTVEGPFLLGNQLHNDAQKVKEKRLFSGSKMGQG